MTVSQLIAELSKMPPDMQVIRHVEPWDRPCVAPIEVVKQSGLYQDGRFHPAVAVLSASQTK